MATRGGVRWETREVGGGRVVYRAAGAGPVVLLVHGPLRSGARFDDLLPLLADGGVRAVAVDLPGFGRSDKPPEGLGFEALAARLSAIGAALGPVALALGEGSGGELAAAAFPAVPVWSIGAPSPRPAVLRALPDPLIRAAVEAWGRLGAPGLRGTERVEAALAARSRGTRAAAATWLRSEPLERAPIRRLPRSSSAGVAREVLAVLGTRR